MNNKIKEIEILKLLALRHIRNLKIEGRLEKDLEKDYIQLKNASSIIIKEHKLSHDINERAFIAKAMVELSDSIQDYLETFNQKDEQLKSIHQNLRDEILGK